MTQDFHYIRREDRSDGICVLTFDRPGSSANVFDATALAELKTHVEALTHDSHTRGVVIRSAKPKIFVAGLDLDMFTESPAMDAVAALIDQGHETFAHLSALKVPTVAAIHGACLGGGFELALACDWRVASDDRATKIGLPEVTLGILPAWGGTTRLPRLIGLARALPAILTGKQFAAKHARKVGLVDDVVAEAVLMAAALEWLARGKRPRRRPSLLDLPPLRNIVGQRAQKSVLAKTRGHYPAPLRALEVARAGVAGPAEESFAREKDALLELVQGPEAVNLLRIFHLRERARKLGVPSEVAARADGAAISPVRRAAVIGAGVMGAGIAHWLSARGVHVLMRDVGAEPLARGMSRIAKLYRDAVARRILTPVEARAALDRVTPMTGDVPLSSMDIVIEAATEKLELKKEIFRQLEARCGEQTVLATNTSALSITEIASVLKRPERLVGMHFFNPVHRMHLVELIHGEHTGARAMDTALQFSKALGKPPVIVRDSPGFVVNRILMPYLVEAVRIFDEGHAPLDIDRAMLDFGMPMGPLRLCDEVGLDTSLHVARDLEARLPEPVPLSDTLDAMIARGWLGRKSGRGFYVHGGRGSRESVNPELARLRQAGTPRSAPADSRDRLVLIMVNEAARCIEAGVVTDPEDVDFAMIMGTGWAPFRGGPLRFADELGAFAVTTKLDELARKHGAHFVPCTRLREMSTREARFYNLAGGTPSAASVAAH